MFGYLKIYENELKLKDIKKYKQKYCELCYGIRKNYGYQYSIFLNYELVFLYIFLESVISDRRCENIKFRCSMNPLKKLDLEVDVKLLEYVSFINYSLVLLKLKDNYNDEKKKLDYLLLHYLQKNRKYLEKKEKYKKIYEEIEHEYDILYRMEKEGNYKFDELSQTMGNVLKRIVMFYETISISDIKLEDVGQFCEHLGKWIYLMDAYDDLEKDRKKKTYNPLNQFEEASEQSALRVGEMMLGMMNFKMNEIINSIPLMENRSIVLNIIGYGTSCTFQRVKQKKLKYKEKGDIDGNCNRNK